ncbi:MAG: hypothetical protein JWO02_1449 [Solirubrobacterales bacterium]|nr:hypothetical protein [Solirubrobacterales bacterium]
MSLSPPLGPSAARAEAGHEILVRVGDALQREGLDVLVATSPENLVYASGAAPPSQRTVRSRLAAAVIAADGPTETIVVMLERPLVLTQTWLDRVTAYVEFEQHPIDAIATSLRDRGLADGRIGIETAHLSHDDVEHLRAALPDAELRSTDTLWSRLRMIKTPSEIAAIRAIGAAAERITAECVQLVGEGSTERELGDLITDRYLAAGGDALTMLVVAAGERSAHLNGPPTDRVLQRGDVVRTDVIGTANAYYSDVARTAIVGDPDQAQQRVYDVLSAAHDACLSMLRPGVLGTDVYRVYHDAMVAAGLPAYHFVGHGLGVTLHEEPFISPRSTIALEAGMVLCIEPLTSIEGQFGMQVEDEILITENGCEPLTRAGALLRIGVA